MKTEPLLQVLKAGLSPGEEVKVLMKGSRLCEGIRLEGVMYIGTALAFLADKAIRGGSWVQGIWALTTENLIYISSPIHAKSQARSFDRKIPISSILKVQEHGRVLRRVYDIAYEGGAVYALVFKGEADKLIPSLEAAIARHHADGR